TYLEIHMTVQANNFREMPEFVALGQRHGCDRVTFHQMLDWGTFPPEEFAARAVQLASHPEHGNFLDMLQNPSLEDSVVYLPNLTDLKRQTARKQPMALRHASA